MKRMTRTLLAGTVLGLSVSSAAMAQISGMPVFTNPRYGTGVRVHADFGQATEATIADRVVQGGVSLAIGPIGLSALVGMLKDDLSENQACVQNPSLDCTDNTVQAAALAQLRVAGGGRSNLSLSLFGGASTEFTSRDIPCSSLPPADQPACVQLQSAYGTEVKELNIPVGVAVGLRIPLGVASLNVWGAPRYNLTRYTNCGGTCPTGDEQFRWAVGADFPILRVLSIRAAYDSGKIGTETVSFWGLGASLGIGGVR
jgi:hypothetical protein